MDENCTVDWYTFTELGEESAGPAACSCEQCRGWFREVRAVGLMPPVGVDVDAWREEVEARVEHAGVVPSRERRRRERARRRSSRLDGRWHRRVNQQRDRQRRFEREAKQALARREAYEIRHGYRDHEPMQEDLEAILADAPGLDLAVYDPNAFEVLSSALADLRAYLDGLG
jgi:hypothetical protein